MTTPSVTPARDPGTHMTDDARRTEPIFTRANDPMVWHPVRDVEGIAYAPAFDDHWLVGSTIVTVEDLLNARTGHLVTEDVFLIAAQNRFDANGGLIGDWEQHQHRWS